eukprot:3939862-Rhodomonas_salina.1
MARDIEPGSSIHYVGNGHPVLRQQICTAHVSTGPPVLRAVASVAASPLPATKSLGPRAVVPPSTTPHYVST